MTHTAARKSRIVISGATGLIGSALVRALGDEGHDVRRLVRGAAREAGDVPWDPARGVLDVHALEGADAVINLAGEPIDQRWSGDAKRRIRESRVASTALLANAIGTLASPPRVLLSGSAVGIYGDRGDEELDERSLPGRDWLASVVRDWEDAAAPAARAGTRVVNMRTGLVLSSRGGALKRLLLPFQLGAGGAIGSGRQWMSWIALREMVEVIRFLLASDAISGPVNLVAPQPVTNRDFARMLAHVLHRPALVPVPALALRLLYGEMADGTILASQRAHPRRLRESGYQFRFPDLESALRAELAGTS